MNEKKIVDVMLIISFTIYILIFIWIVYLKCNVESWINASKELFNKMSLLERITYDIIPFKTNLVMREQSYFYNVIIFIPYPIYLKLINDKLKFKKILLIGFITTAFIELSQLFIPFCGFASEDIICNFSGIIIGSVIIIILKPKEELKIALSLMGIFLIPMIIVIIINTINNIDIYFRIFLLS